MVANRARSLAHCHSLICRFRAHPVLLSKLAANWRLSAPERATDDRRPPRTGRTQKKRAYGTPDSHVVPHRSTDEACSGLTAQFGRDTVCYTEYGRRHLHSEISAYKNPRTSGLCRQLTGGPAISPSQTQHDESVDGARRGRSPRGLRARSARNTATAPMLELRA